MDESTVKARIASILNVPMWGITLVKKKGCDPHIKMNAFGKYIIEYETLGSLIHELFHACFTPPGAGNGSLLYNALEDVRIDDEARKYDPQLANVVTDEMHEMMDVVAKTTPQEEVRLLKALSLPLSVSPEPLLKDVPVEHKKLIEKARKLLQKSSGEISGRVMREAYQLVEDLFPNSKNKQKQEGKAKGGFKEIDERLMHETTERQRRRVDSDEDSKSLKIRTKEREGPALPDRPDVYKITKGIIRIIQNKAIGKRQNTIEGRLQSKRLGRLPSKYVFTKKQNASPKTELFLLVDLSGSMWTDKLSVVVRYVNTLRKIKETNLKISIRGFNGVYFKDDEVGINEDDIHEKNMNIQAPRGDASDYNDDAHFLKIVIDEIHESTTPNKCLLILSDGQPAPSSIYELTDLTHVVNKYLEKSNIPYASIGILDNSVEDYYPKNKCVVIDSLSDFAEKTTSEILKLLTNV